MSKVRFASVDEYLAAQPESVRPILERVRGAIRKALPAAEEAISYQIPAFRVDGRVVIYFAGWKEHYAIYPASDRIVHTFKKELADCEISKGTIRFALSRRVPARLIQAIAKLRAVEVTERVNVKKVKAKKQAAS